MEILSKGTRLMCSATKDGTYQTLYGLQSTPDMGGDPDKVDVTNLMDGARRYIRGIKDYGDLDFGFYYNSKDDNPNVTEDMVAASYSTLRGYDKAETKVWFKLVYPDGEGFQWCGGVSVKKNAAEVNAALQFTLRVMCETDLEDITEALPVSAASAGKPVAQMSK